MAAKTTPTPDVNDWLEDELYQQYRHNRASVDESWQSLFEGNGHGEPAAPQKKPPEPALARQRAVAVEEQPALALGPSQQLMPLRGAAARIALNMNASLAVPTASSQRIIPVKVMEENRRIINEHRTMLGKSKISFSHLIGYAIVQALKKHPNINDAYTERDGEPFRVVQKEVNLGVAIDVQGSGGARSLVVPNIKNAGGLNFFQYMEVFDDLVARARRGRLAVDDFQGTTISLTNPGTVGTVFSLPRLMAGQGAIIAVGAIDYPAEYQGATPETLALLGVSKVMVMSCTYDHRIIQGAESGMFLATLQELLQGADSFYDQIFADLKMPHNPVKWEPDRGILLPGAAPGHLPEIAKEAAILQLINAYRVRGHLIADLDPLGTEPHYHPELDPATYGLTIWDLDREFHPGNLGAPAGEAAPYRTATLRIILDTLRKTYCAKIGCEYMNIQHPEQKTWLQQRMEPRMNSWPLAAEDRLRILDRLIAAELFENFLHSRFIGQKRFSLEGGETAIAILDELLDRAADDNVHEVVIGMAHRGRLNVLANVVGKPLRQVFSEFEGHPDPASTQGSGDVKYHLGASGVHSAPSGREIAVSVAPNPSHLEAVDPVVEGIVRPKQDRLGDRERVRVIPVLIHGDAAFAGQGVVAETLNLSQLQGYTTGGTIHLIINNQIGFTTRPDEARSTPYSTDVARMVQAPIFHVNGDDPEACIRALQVAFEFRQTFRKDVVIDMFCYRRHGHNEGDDPSYTSPLLYRKIENHPPVSALYAERLTREGLISSEEAEKIRKRASGRLEAGFTEAREHAVRYEIQEMGIVEEYAMPKTCARTAADAATLEKVIDALTSFPPGFTLHPKLDPFIQRRRAALEGAAVDWALAEALAFGSLVLEGTPVSLSGQDSSRGTFSQRHLELYDYENGSLYIPLQHLAPDQARFEVWDSHLSEYAVMGFEFGYSIGDPLSLVLWEAQFGDFVNGAQIMVDQFITTAEQKWGQPSGLVLLLPHGFEGQGPEHSSARIERFLILCAENNIQVSNPTTADQYFHLLRRQMYGGHDRRGMRKPLVIFTPKSLLRHPKVGCALGDLTRSSFREVIGEREPQEADRVSRILICSGKIYYELAAARAEKHVWHVAIVRLEQYYPFPRAEMEDQLTRYSPTCDVVWVQEEPRNMGAWRFVREQIEPLLAGTRRTLRYVGRVDSASPATGSYKQHLREQSEIVEACFAEQRVQPVRKVRLVQRKKNGK